MSIGRLQVDAALVEWIETPEPRKAPLSVTWKIHSWHCAMDYPGRYEYCVSCSKKKTVGSIPFGLRERSWMTLITDPHSHKCF